MSGIVLGAGDRVEQSRPKTLQRDIYLEEVRRQNGKIVLLSSGLARWRAPCFSLLPPLKERVDNCSFQGRRLGAEGCGIHTLGELAKGIKSETSMDCITFRLKY